MSWESIALILSLVLNVIFTVMIFFKKALNEIIVRWFARRWQRQDESRTAMLELHGRMDTFSMDYLVTIVHVAMIERAKTQQERDRLVQQREELNEKLAKTHEFIRRHRLEFPQPVQALLENLRACMQLSAMEDFTDSRVVLKASEGVAAITSQLRKEIARRVRS